MSGPKLNKSLERAIHILNLMAKEGPMGLRELSRSTHIPLASVDRILNTLEKHNFVTKDESGKIQLGRELYYLGKIVESRMSKIRIILQEIKELIKEIDETIYLVERRDTCIFFIEGVYSSHHIQFVPKSEKLYDLPFGAAGKAFMAYMEKEEVMNIINDFNLNAPELLNELMFIRERGYAMSNQREFGELYELAFPIFNKDGSVSYLFDVAIPNYRYSYDKLDFIINRVKSTVKRLSDFPT